MISALSLLNPVRLMHCHFGPTSAHPRARGARVVSFPNSSARRCCLSPPTALTHHGLLRRTGYQGRPIYQPPAAVQRWHRSTTAPSAGGSANL